MGKSEKWFNNTVECSMICPLCAGEALDGLNLDSIMRRCYCKSISTVYLKLIAAAIIAAGLTAGSLKGGAS